MNRYPLEVRMQVDHRKEVQSDTQLFMITLLLPHIPMKSGIYKGMHECLLDIQSRLPKHMVWITEVEEKGKRVNLVKKRGCVSTKLLCLRSSFAYKTPLPTKLLCCLKCVKAVLFLFGWEIVSQTNRFRKFIRVGHVSIRCTLLGVKAVLEVSVALSVNSTERSINVKFLKECLKCG